MINEENEHEQLYSYLPGILFTITFIAGILIAVQYGNNENSWASLTLSSYGTLLSGLGTVGLCFLALHQIPFELKKFRRESQHQASLERDRQDRQAIIERNLRLEEKQELVAAESLEAAIRLENAISHISNPFSYTGEGSSNEIVDRERAANGTDKHQLQSQLFLDMFNSRVQAVRPDLEFFLTTKIKARVYLSEEIVSVIKDLDIQYKKLRVNAKMWSSGLAQGPTVTRDAVFQRNYTEFHDTSDVRSELVREKISELEILVRNYIHPNQH